jgi:hypothetical protein
MPTWAQKCSDNGSFRQGDRVKTNGLSNIALFLEAELGNQLGFSDDHLGLANKST